MAVRRKRQPSNISSRTIYVESAKVRFLQLTGFLNRTKGTFNLESMSGDIKSECITLQGASSNVGDAAAATEMYLTKKVIGQKWPPLDDCSLSALRKPDNVKEITNRLHASKLIVTWNINGNTITTYACSQCVGNSGYEIIVDVISPGATARNRHASTGKARLLSQSSDGSSINFDGCQRVSDLQYNVRMYLQLSGFLKEIKELCGLDELKLDTKTKSIYVSGIQEQQAISEIKKKVESLYRSPPKAMSKPLLEILSKSKEVKEEITQSFKAQGLVAPWELCGNNSVSVCSDSKTSADRGVAVIESTLCECEISLSDEQLSCVYSRNIVTAFNTEFAPNQKAIKGECCITVYSSELGINAAVDNIKSRIEKAKPQTTKELALQGKLLYVHRYHQLDIDAAMNRTYAKVKERDGVLSLTGSADAVELLYRDLSSLSENIKQADLDDGVILSYVRGHTKKVRSNIEIPTKTVLQVFYSRSNNVGSNSGRASMLGGENWLLLNNVKLTAVLGDITTFQADGLVNTTGQSRNLSHGTVGPALLRRAGTHIQDSLLKASPIYPGLYKTSGFASVKYIYHCVIVQSNHSVKTVETYVSTIVKEASDSGLTSLALPMIGTGNTGVQPAEVAQTIIQCLVKFSEIASDNQPLLNITVVILPQQSSMYQMFCNVLKKVVSSNADALITTSPTSGGNSCLRVFYGDPSGLNEVKLKLEQLRRELVRDIVWTDVYPGSSHILAQLTSDQIDRMRHAAQSRRVRLNVIKQSEVVTNLTLKGPTEEVQELERLFTSWFPAREKFPSNWRSPLTEYRESVLQINSQEFSEVSGSFFTSLGRIVEIAWIKRIQNPHQYKLFTAEREAVAAKLGKSYESVSRSNLWHGADSDSINKICRNGFNRSFAGAHGTAYGHGCYFAVRAHYSDRYSLSDSSGWKYIISAKIVVGAYILGNSSMKTAPYIGSPSAATHYNTTVDSATSPTIYVTYTDAAAYPEYVISYR